MEKNELIILFKNLLSSLYESEDKYENLQSVPFFLFSPIEYNDVLTEKSKTYAMDLVTELIFSDKKEILFPFDRFIIDIGRVTMDTNDGDNFSKLNIYTALYVINNIEEIQIFQLLIPEPYNSQLPIISAEILFESEELYEFLMDRFNKKILFRISFSSTLNNIQGKKFLPLTNQETYNPLSMHIAKWIEGTTANYVFYFLEYLNTPSNYIVQKYSPKYKNYSTEFVLSQSHFLIINRKKIMNAIKGNEENSFDREVSKRYFASHQRRGYLRRYKHSRYKNMSGKSSWVKPAWVGPTEWFGSDKKIYKVVIDKNK